MARMDAYARTQAGAVLLLRDISAPIPATRKAPWLAPFLGNQARPSEAGTEDMPDLRPPTCGLMPAVGDRGALPVGAFATPVDSSRLPVPIPFRGRYRKRAPLAG